MTPFPLFPKTPFLTGPAPTSRLFCIYDNGEPIFWAQFCYFWDFLGFAYAVEICRKGSPSISPIFGCWN